jgi:UPF0176 protein
LAEAARASAGEVGSGYRFAPVADPDALRDRLEQRAAELDLLGTVLIAPEGVNLSLSGPVDALDAFERTLAAEPGFEGFRSRRTPGFGARPFRRLKVRCRREIVSLGRNDEACRFEGTRAVDAGEWHALLDDPDVLVIDVRNDYEVAAGTFPGSVDPGTRGFREFPCWVESHLDPDRHRTVAMFCTGGIRCEKVAAWMRGRGFDDVRELAGGILGYLDHVPEDQSRWQGDCFVFDDRVSLTTNLEQGELEVCHGCRRPLTPDMRASNAFEPGVSCPECIDDLTPADLRGRRERRRQVGLEQARGRDHLAPARSGPLPNPDFSRPSRPSRPQEHDHEQ